MSELAERAEKLSLEVQYALQQSDYTTAYEKAVQLDALLMGVPNTEQAGIRIEWRPTKDAIARLEREKNKQSGHGKVARVPLTYKRPGCEDDCYCR